MKKALVVGGANGIGLSIATQLAKRKDYEKIYLVDKVVVSEEFSNPKFESIKFNLISDDFSIFNGFKDIDTLMITAGFGKLSLFKDISEQCINNSFSVNSVAPIRIIHHFMDRLTGKGDFLCGVMVSIAGFMSSPFFAVYGATKAALKIFIESVNVELEKGGSTNRILNVSPGSIKGTSFNNGKTDLSVTKDLAKEIIELINYISMDINANPKMKEKLNVVFMEDYCVTLAEYLMPASEISEQISLAGYEASGTGNMKFMINGAITFGTMDGANVEICDAVGEDNIFIFGMSAKEVDELWKQGYNSTYYYNNSKELRSIIATLKRGFAGKNFENIANYLLTTNGIADRYMCLADFENYLDVYHIMDEKYKDTKSFNQMSLVNISQAGRFAADRSIKEYCDNIWHLKQVK